ncbi:MAG: hypothetical protein ACFHWX_06100 [Bacteroidota bacterium]
MTQLSEIPLAQKGLIVFGARPGMGLTRTAIKLSYYLSLSETVLFISYQTYEERLIRICEDLNFKKPDTLIFDTSLDYYSFKEEYLYCLRRLVEEKKPKTLVVDDLDTMLGEHFELEESVRNELIEEIRSFINQKDMRCIMNVTISAKTDYRGGAHEPKLSDFTWCRQLVNAAAEIYTLYRPDYYGMSQDEYGNDLKGHMDINCVKDINCIEKKFTISCDKEFIIPYPN